MIAKTVQLHKQFEQLYGSRNSIDVKTAEMSQTNMAITTASNCNSLILYDNAWLTTMPGTFTFCR